MPGLSYVLLVFLPYMLLRSFTATPTCGMNRANRCPYPPFPFPTITPDTGTGSGYPNRTFIGPLVQPLLELAPIGEYRMCQRAVRRLCNPCERCLVRKVARLLAQPLIHRSAWNRYSAKFAPGVSGWHHY